jgi:hypothetical protein
MASTYDHTVARGSSGEFTALKFQPKNRDAEGNEESFAWTAGDNLIFSATWAGGSLTKSFVATPTYVTVDVSDPDNILVKITFTAAETRALPKGRMTRYEIEWRPAAGGQDQLLNGFIIATGDGLTGD